MIAKILNAILLIPELLKSVRDLQAAIQKISDGKFFEDSARLRAALETSLSEEGKRDAAKRAADLIQRM